MRRFASRIIRLFKPSEALRYQLEPILGYNPVHLPYYQAALMHRSKIEEIAENNERLEFLGDAILGAVVAEYLFKRYPYQPEGFLTELRSRIVRRESLNALALQMGLDKLVQYNQADRGLSRSHIFGNALEALVGAVYLDVGYNKTRTFILRQMIKGYVDIEMLESTDTNYKNRLLSWAQRQGKKVHFDTLDEKNEGSRKVFTMGIVWDGKVVGQATGFSKKEAGQMAAQKAIEALGIKDEEETKP
jgi:ribonuclease-3